MDLAGSPLTLALDRLTSEHFFPLPSSPLPHPNPRLFPSPALLSHLPRLPFPFSSSLLFPSPSLLSLTCPPELLPWTLFFCLTSVFLAPRVSVLPPLLPSLFPLSLSSPSHQLSIFISFSSFSFVQLFSSLSFSSPRNSSLIFHFFPFLTYLG